MELQILGYIFEGIAIVSSLIAAFAAIKRDPKYRINQLMAIAMVFMSLYVGLIMAYDVIFYNTGDPQIVFISFPQALVSIVTAAIFLYLAMKCITKSTKWLTILRNWLPHAVILVIFTIFINVVPFITIIHESENVNTQMDIYVLFVVILIVIYYLITSIVIIYREGIRKTTENTRKKLIIFEIGLLTDLSAVFVNIFAQITSNPTTGEILDIIFFGILALGSILFSIGFLLSSSTRKACEVCN